MQDKAWWDGPAVDDAIRAAEPLGQMSYRALDAVLPCGVATTRQIELLIEHLRQRGIELHEDEPTDGR